MFPLIVLAFIVCVHSIITPKIIDGFSSDWNPDELFEGGENSRWGVSWDDNFLYFSLNSSSLNTTITANKFVGIWINTYQSYQQAKYGPSYGVLLPKTPFVTTYHISFRLSDGVTRLYSNDNGYPGWTNQTITGINASRTREFLELSIEKYQLSYSDPQNSPGSIYVCGCFIDITTSRLSNSFPKSFTPGNYNSSSVGNTWPTHIGLPIKSRYAVPNLRDFNNVEMHRQSYTPQSIISGDWNDNIFIIPPSIWTQGSKEAFWIVADSFFYILNGTTVFITNLPQPNKFRHLFIEPGATFIQIGDFRINSQLNSSSIINYGNFISNGTIFVQSRFSTFGTIVEFYNIEIRNMAIIGGCRIKNYLTMGVGGYLPAGNSVNYLDNSTLFYAIDSVRGPEWESSITNENPYHVILEYYTTLNITNNSFNKSRNLYIRGNLVMNPFAIFNMFGYQGNVTIAGNLNSTLGTIRLSNFSQSFIIVNGTINSGIIYCYNNTILNSRLEPFNKPTIQGQTQLNSFGTTTLSVASVNVTYQWSNGQTTSAITVNTTGMYWVKVTSYYGCSALSNAVEVVPYFYTSGLVTTARVTSGESTSGLVASVLTSGGVTTGLEDESSGPFDNNRVIGAAVGASIGTVVVIGLAILVILLLIRKKESKKEKSNVEMSTIPENSMSPIVPSATKDEYNVLPLGRDDKKEDDYRIYTSPNSAESSSPLKFKWEIKYSELSLGHVLGQGSFGVVYQARWRNTDVAVKQVRNDKVTPEMRESFVKEVELLSHLRPHSNVVQFWAACISPLCMVIEYLANGNLFDYLRAHSDIVNSQKVKWLSGIAAGMRHLQEESIVHRDLAARNVLLTNDLNVKISDFGMSRETQGDIGGVTKSDIGPVRWMAPESLMNREYSVKTDVWSFGVVIFEVFAVQTPYAIYANEQVVSMVVTQKLSLKLPEGVPNDVIAVFEDCMQMNKDKRPDFVALSSRFEAINAYSTF